jgi:putative hemolysin
MIQEFILLAVLITANAFFAAAEIAIVSVRKTRLRQLAEDGNRSAQVAERLSEDSSRFLATIQVGITLAGFFTSATAAVTLSDAVGAWIATLPLPEAIVTHGQAIAVFLITTALAFITLVLGELVPKTLALQYAEPIALAVARPIDWLSRLASPIVRLLSATTNLIAGRFGATQISPMPFVTEAEIKTIVDAGEEGGVIEEEEKAMIYSIFDLGETLAREVMVPRIDVTALESTAPLKEAVQTILEAGHSRIPVYVDTVDNIVGILYAKDLLRYLGNGQSGASDVSLSDIVRPPYFVPESKRIDELLRELQVRRVHMAIVVDEYGGTAGLVTIEDILEEIVGEIQDEYDIAEEPAVERVGPDEYVFDARADLDDVNDLLDTQLPKELGETLGGFIYGQLGKVPATGERLSFNNNVEMEVLEVIGRRIGKVRVRRLVAETSSTPVEGAGSER